MLLLPMSALFCQAACSTAARGRIKHSLAAGILTEVLELWPVEEWHTLRNCYSTVAAAVLPNSLLLPHLQRRDVWPRQLPRNVIQRSRGGCCRRPKQHKSGSCCCGLRQQGTPGLLLQMLLVLLLGWLRSRMVTDAQACNRACARF
jgi:hypothetical protein